MNGPPAVADEGAPGPPEVEDVTDDGPGILPDDVGGRENMADGAATAAGTR